MKRVTLSACASGAVGLVSPQPPNNKEASFAAVVVNDQTPDAVEVITTFDESAIENDAKVSERGQNDEESGAAAAAAASGEGEQIFWRNGWQDEHDWKDVTHKCANLPGNGCAGCNEFTGSITEECYNNCLSWLGLDKWFYDALSPMALFGRYLMCLTAFAPARRKDNQFSVVDTFLGPFHGSARMFTHGFQHRCQTQNVGGRLLTFEKNFDYIQKAWVLLGSTATTALPLEWERKSEQWRDEFMQFPVETDNEEEEIDTRVQCEHEDAATCVANHIQDQG